MNAEAARQVMDMGAGRFLLSPEDGLENMRELLQRFGARAGVIVFQDTPLYLAENCVQVARDGRCPGPAACEFRQMELRSSHDDRLLVVNRKCRMIVVNKSPFCLADRLPELEGGGRAAFPGGFLLAAVFAGRGARPVAAGPRRPRAAGQPSREFRSRAIVAGRAGPAIGFLPASTPPAYKENHSAGGQLSAEIR